MIAQDTLKDITDFITSYLAWHSNTGANITILEKGVVRMAKVVGIVALELNPGFTDERVRELATDTIREFRVPGVVSARLGQGIRGDRHGNYVLIWEFESVETMERYFPMPSKPSDAWERNTAGA